MVRIEINIDSDKILKSCRAVGHAGYGTVGTDIVCAAVSILMRTAVSILSDKVEIKSEVPGKGNFYFEIIDYGHNKTEFLRTTGIFLLEGIRSLVEEYPQNVNLTINET